MGVCGEWGREVLWRKGTGSAAAPEEAMTACCQPASGMQCCWDEGRMYWRLPPLVVRGLRSRAPLPAGATRSPSPATAGHPAHARTQHTAHGMHTTLTLQPFPGVGGWGGWGGGCRRPTQRKAHRPTTQQWGASCASWMDSRPCLARRAAAAPAAAGQGQGRPHSSSGTTRPSQHPSTSARASWRPPSSGRTSEGACACSWRRCAVCGRACRVRGGGASGVGVQRCGSRPVYVHGAEHLPLARGGGPSGVRGSTGLPWLRCSCVQLAVACVRTGPRCVLRRRAGVYSPPPLTPSVRASCCAAQGRGLGCGAADQLGVCALPVRDVRQQPHRAGAAALYPRLGCWHVCGRSDGREAAVRVAGVKGCRPAPGSWLLLPRPPPPPRCSPCLGGLAAHRGHAGRADVAAGPASRPLC